MFFIDAVINGIGKENKSRLTSPVITLTNNEIKYIKNVISWL